MPNIHYRTISGASVDHLNELESYLDNNHHSLSHDLHEELSNIFESMNDAARSAWAEKEDQINELESENAELKSEVERLEREAKE
jgi:hypothetical protein